MNHLIHTAKYSFKNRLFRLFTTTIIDEKIIHSGGFKRDHDDNETKKSFFDCEDEKWFPEQLNSGDKTVSDYPESRVMLQPSTRYLHNDNTGAFGTDPNADGEIEGIRVSQRNQIKNSAVLKLVVAGTSELQAGEIIQFDYPRIEPNKGGNAEYAFDPKYSGRYMIKRLRHRLIRGNYRMVLE